MKRRMKLGILALCAVLVYLGVFWANREFVKSPNITPMDAGQLVFSLEGTKTLSWVSGEETICFDLSAENWVLQSDASYQLSKLSKNDILKAISEIRTRKIIDDPGDLAQYGLEQPVCTITADDTIICIGDKTAVGAQRYLSIGDGKVYTVTETILYPFTRTLEQMAK